MCSQMASRPSSVTSGSSACSWPCHVLSPPLEVFSSSASSAEGPGDSADDRHRRVTAGAPHWQLRLRLSLGHDTRSLQESVRPPHPTGPWRGGTRPGLCGPVGRWARSLHAAARGTSPQGHGLPGLLCLVSREQPRAPLWPSQAWLWGVLGGTPQPSLSQGHTRPCRAGSELPTPEARDPRGLQGPLGWGGPAEPVSTLGDQLVPPRQTVLPTALHGPATGPEDSDLKPRSVPSAHSGR